jgi:hypothetical protein
MSLETETITITGLQPGTTASLEELARQEGKATGDWLRHWLQVKLLTLANGGNTAAPTKSDLQSQEVTELEAQVEAQGHKFYGIFADDPGAMEVFDEIERLR